MLRNHSKSQRTTPIRLPPAKPVGDKKKVINESHADKSSRAKRSRPTSPIMWATPVEVPSEQRLSAKTSAPQAHRIPQQPNPDYSQCSQTLASLADTKNESGDNTSSVSFEPNRQLQRIATRGQHISVLQYALLNAKKNILITSYAINHSTLLKANIYELIAQSRAQGVKIYIYCNDQKNVTSDIKRFFKKHGVTFAQAYTHSKILAVDGAWVAVGSFNWLSDAKEAYKETSQGSVICRGEVCRLLIQDFWKHIRNIRHQQFGRYKKLIKFERNPYHQAIIGYALDEKEKSELVYLPTLSAHREYLYEIFKTADRRIIICSPFISPKGEYQRDFSHRMLAMASRRRVDVMFVCRNGDSYLSGFIQYIKQLSLPHIYIYEISSIHLKAIIVDQDTIVEGSFNWLSATRDRESKFYKHEVSLAVEGEAAKPLISAFFQSKVGQAINSKSAPIDVSQSNRSTWSERGLAK